MLSSPPGRLAFYLAVGASLLAISLLWAALYNAAPPKHISVRQMVYATAVPEK